MSEKIYPFNNEVDTGLRMLVLLTTSYPSAFDIDHLIYFDYMVVHTGDFNPEVASLHPAVPNRAGELFVRRALIQSGLNLFIAKGLLSQSFTSNGIEYIATENSVPFLDSLSSEYSNQLINRADWVMQRFSKYRVSELKKFFDVNLSNVVHEYNLQILR